ncbi:MAG: hypothetical protein ACYTAF_03485 [Planctomycetota bacterium]|jgi:hypothetical protein
MGAHFVVLHKDYGRLAGWFQFFAPQEAILRDRILAEKFFRSQWDPNREPGMEGHSLSLSAEEATRVRLWFDYVPDIVLDESDEDFAERIDEFLARYA